MRWILRIFGVLIGLAIIVVGGLFAFYMSVREPVPNLAIADHLVRPIVAADPATIARAHDRLLAVRQKLGFPSASIAVASNGQIVWSETFGYADLASARPATSDTQYAVGSVSKTLTAAVVMRLVDRGLIDLDADIRTYVPAFPQKPYRITTRQLLSHQAGIRHYQFSLTTPPVFSDTGSRDQYNSVTDSLRMFAVDPLLFEPDTAFNYSTYGYTLLSAVVEGATRRPFLEVMQNELFVPLGMTSSGADDKLHPTPQHASDYQNFALDGHVIPAPFVNVSNKWAGGGFRSTPADLARFGIALLDDKIIRPETRTLMFTPRTLKNGKVNDQNYGLGIRIDEITEPSRPGAKWLAVHHGGVAIGSQAFLLLLPKERIVVAFTGNATVNGTGMFDAITDIAIIFADAAPKPSADAATPR
jgi:serine beta-lactamase-like protein LACTB